MIVQVVTCINMLAAHEAELLSAQCALDFSALQRVLNVSSAQSFVTENWLDRFKLAEDPMEVRRRRTESISEKSWTGAGTGSTTRLVTSRSEPDGAVVAENNGHRGILVN